jgi:hypothetical protein
MTPRLRLAALAALLAAALAAQSDAQDKKDVKDEKARAAATENLTKIKIDNPTIEESENFVVAGAISKDRAQALAKVLEKTLPVARKAAKLDDKDTAWKGKLIVYYLPDGDHFKTFMRKVLQIAPEGFHSAVRSEPAFVVDPADDIPGKPADADLFAVTAARVAGEVFVAKGGTAVIPVWLRDGFGRVVQMRAEGTTGRRYTAYKAAARGAVLNPKGGKAPSIGDAASDVRSATGEALANSVAEFLAYGPKAADFGKFIDGLRPSETVQNPTILNGYMALGWKEEAMVDAAWKKWVQTGK